MTSTRREPLVVVVTNIPSPYQVELFDAIAARGDLRLSAVYTERDMAGRSWTWPVCRHDHTVFDESHPDAALAKLAAADLVVFSGYRGASFQVLMKARDRQRRPWCFWGERPGFQRPGPIGRAGRMVAQWRIRRAAVPIWGIGAWAVEGYRREIGGNRLYVNMPYCSRLDRFLAIPRDLRSGSGPTRFLFSGLFSHRKGVDLLAEAFVGLAQEGHHVSLSYLGSGELEHEVRRIAAPVADRVSFLGFKQWAELPDVYGAHDVLVAPSRHDGWGLIVPEGLAAGMPVVATEAMGAARDLLTAAAGWRIPSEDVAALRDAMRAAAVQTQVGRHGMALAARAAVQQVTAQAGAARFHQAVEATLAAWADR